MPSSALSMFHPDLIQVLYQRSASPDLVDQAEPELLSEPRFPQLNPVKWDEAVTAHVSITRALFDTTVRLPRCELNNFAIECARGGRAAISCRIQTRCDDKTIGDLAGLLDSVSTLTVDQI